MRPTLGERALERAPGRLLGGLALLAFLGGVAWILALARATPAHNFDLVDYVALVFEWTEDDPLEVHRRTYAALEAELPPEVFASFTAGEFRATIARDPTAFQQNLGFHRGRFLYTLLVLGLHRAGVPVVEATAWPNLIFWPLTAALLLIWTRRYFALAPAVLVALGILYSPPVLSQVAGASPDSLAMFFLTLGLYLVLEHRRFVPALALLTLTVLVRSDFVLVCGGIGVGLFLFVEPERRPGTGRLALWLLASAAVYLSVSRLAHDPGWWAAFVGVQRRQAYLDQLIPFKLRYYLLGMQEKLRAAHRLGYDPGEDYVRGSNFVLSYVVAACAGVLLALRARARALDVQVAVLAGLVIASVARIVVFPILWDRYFVYLWIPVPMCLLALAVELARRAPNETRD